jgi:uncharacterized protein (TIGR02217 family)
MSTPVMSTSVPWSLVKRGFHKSPKFTSEVQVTAANRGNSGLSTQPYATWEFDIDLNLVLGGEAQTSLFQSFLGCYMACSGRARRFLFTDPNDNAVATAQSSMLNVSPGATTPMGTVGDGTSTQFQLARKIDQAFDILQQVSGATVYVNGTSTAVVISDTGVVTFSSAPAASAVLTWAGSFRYLCRFADDSIKDLVRINKNSSGFLWSGSVAFESEFV